MELKERSWLYYTDSGCKVKLTEQFVQWGVIVRNYRWEVLNQDGSLAAFRGKSLQGSVGARSGGEVAALAEAQKSAEHALASLLDWRSSGALV